MDNIHNTNNTHNMNNNTQQDFTKFSNIQQNILKVLPGDRTELVKKTKIPRSSLFIELSKLGDWVYTTYGGKQEVGSGLLTQDLVRNGSKGRPLVIFKIKEKET